MFEWTGYAIARLERLWNAGVSTEQIGQDLGCTKNAAIGKARRLGLEPRLSPIIRDGRIPKDSAPRGPGRATRQQAARLPTIASVVPRVADLNEKRAAQLDRYGVSAQVVRVDAPPVKIGASKGCCWPMWGNERPTGVFCDAPARMGKPYCAGHCAIAYERGTKQGWVGASYEAVTFLDIEFDAIPPNAEPVAPAPEPV